jgi:hypothetical protein
MFAATGKHMQCIARWERENQVDRARLSQGR